MKVFFFSLPEFLSPQEVSIIIHFIPFPLLPSCYGMMYIFDLPTDLLRVILESVSLKDIARLQLAASNRHFQQILVQTLDGLTIQSEVRNNNTYLEWMRKYHVRLTSISVTGAQAKASPTFISYVEEQGQYITQLRCMVNNNSTFEQVAHILHNLPNISVLRYAIAIRSPDNFESFYQWIHSLPIRDLFILTHDDEIDIKMILTHLPLLNSIDLEEEVNFDGMGDSIYPDIKQLKYPLTDISDLRYFPNLLKLTLQDFNLSVKNAEILCSHCPHLTCFELFRYSQALYGIHHLLRSLRSLTTLTIFSATPILQPLVASPAQQTTCPNLVDVSLPHALMTTILPYCPNLRDLQLRSSKSIFHQVLIDELQRLRKLRTLRIYSYVYACDVIFHHPYSELTTISIYCESARGIVIPADNIPAYLPVIPKLRAIEGLYHLSPATCAVLRQCPTLTEITVNDINDDIDIELLYAACPHLKSIEYYRGRQGYKLLQCSHDKLESIGIGNYDHLKSTEPLPLVSFPSLRALEVHGVISVDSWNDMLTTASFTIERLILTKSSNLDVIWDSLLAHSNFSGLKYVFCDKLDYAGMQQLFQRSGGWIQFHRLSWLQ